MHIFDTYIEDLNKKYNILIVDLPGHGQSKEYKNIVGFENTAKEIFDIIEKLNIDKISIWGISLGGVIAKYMLKMDSDKIEKIMFEGPAFMIDNIFLRRLFKMFNSIKMFLPKSICLRLFIYAVIPGKKLRKHDMKCMICWLLRIIRRYLIG